MNDNHHLTNYEFWKNYWQSKKGLAFKIPKNYPFTATLGNLITKNHCKSLIEIGGFPGYYSVWAKSNFKLDVTLLDFVIVPEIIDHLKMANACNGTIHVIEKDLFDPTEPLSKLYDIVISNGLIEHFENTKEIIQKHLDFFKTNGTLMISLPNFKGLNGWFQKTFDKENYDKHFIKCMDLSYLKNICQELNLSNIEVKYTGGFMLWLENPSEKSIFTRLFRFLCWLPLKIFIKLVPFESKFLSPYILITANKI